MAVSDAAASNSGESVDCEVDLGETVRAIDNMRLVVHEGRPSHAHAQMAPREADCRSSVSSRGSASAAAVVREYQVRVMPGFGNALVIRWI